MRRWIFACLALWGWGCSGTSDDAATPLHKLCMEACAHVRAKNCFEAPAIGVDQCRTECSDLQSISGNPCTDEQAELFACTSKAEITCGGSNGEAVVVNGCEAEMAAIDACETPGMTCTRTPGSDDICLFQFGFSQFFVCSEGAFPAPECIPINATGFCCP